MNARIFFEYAYLAIALYCAYEVYNLWGTADRTQWYIRLTNLVGCALFVVYGYLINSIPVILPNSFLIIVQIVYIWRELRKKK